MTTAEINNTKSIVELALNEVERQNYAFLKSKQADDYILDKDEDKIFKEYGKKIADVRAKIEKAPKLEAFKTSAQELQNMGFSIAELIAAIKPVKPTTEPVVLATFPEITYKVKIKEVVDGKTVEKEVEKVFEFIDGNRYGPSGNFYDAFQKFKALGYDAIVKKLEATEAGKAWINKTDTYKRDSGTHKKGDVFYPNQEDLKKKLGTVKAEEPKADAKPAAKPKMK